MFVAGLAVGSFLNVCIYRIPEGKSLLRPGSHCPHCGAPIRSYDNIPLLSYALLRGRCRLCQAKISVRYPIVELLTAIIICERLLLIQLSKSLSGVMTQNWANVPTSGCPRLWIGHTISERIEGRWGFRFDRVNGTENALSTYLNMRHQCVIRRFRG
ncbi:MAG: prepilin peptidase [bacterium]